MAYTNAIFHIDLVNGSDAARTALTNCIASNPSGTITRINKTGHGLVTGAVVNLTLFSAWLNGAFKITVVDADNFDLDNTVWQATADNDGTVTPRGGSSWSDAWLTINNGATSARIDPGDEIRIAKTPDPVSIGNATWTSLSNTVTLATAQTQTLYLDGTWTAANSGTVTTNSNTKQGTNSAQNTTASTTTTNTKYAYYATGTLDLSSYDAITLWIRPLSFSIAANTFKIALCSDATGDTIVDEFLIPALDTSLIWIPITLTRVGGGNLGASIQSIAWYTGSSTPGNSRAVTLDNILACNSTGLNLTSLISKASTTTGSDETWHSLQSIVDTTVIIGNSTDLQVGSIGLRGYWTNGTTPETVTTYTRPTFKYLASTNQTVNRHPPTKSGTAGNLIKYLGGWDTSTNTQNGDTWVDGQNCRGFGFRMFNVSFLGIDRLHFCRFYEGLAVPTIATIEVKNMNAVSCAEAGFNVSVINSLFENITANNSGSINFPTSSILFNNTILSARAMNGGGLNLSPRSLINSVVLGNSNNSITAQQDSTINYILCKNNSAGSAGVLRLANQVFIKEAELLNNATGIITDTNSDTAYIDKLTSTSTTTTTAYTGYLTVYRSTTSETPALASGTNTERASHQSPAIKYNAFNNNVNDNRSFWRYGNALSQTTVRNTASGVAWQINITNTAQTEDFPVYFPIAKVACTANNLVTVKAFVKLSHATNIGAKLGVRNFGIPGVTADVTTTKTADTNWEELTITFTPTVQVVADIYIFGYWRASTANQSIYVDDITITQA